MQQNQNEHKGGGQGSWLDTVVMLLLERASHLYRLCRLIAPRGFLLSLFLVFSCAGPYEVDDSSLFGGLSFIPHESSVEVSWSLEDLTEELTSGEEVEQIVVSWQPTYTPAQRAQILQRHAAVDIDGDNASYVGGRAGDDNCPSIYNPLQEDEDKDGYGDACDLAPNKALVIIPDDQALTMKWKNPQPSRQVSRFRVFWLYSDGRTHTDFVDIRPDSSQGLDITFTNGESVDGVPVELVNEGEYRFDVDVDYADGTGESLYDLLIDPPVALGANFDGDQLRDEDDEDDDNDGIRDINELVSFAYLSAVKGEINITSRGAYGVEGLVNNSEYEILVQAIIFDTNVSDTNVSQRAGNNQRVETLGRNIVLLGPNPDNDGLANQIDPDDDNDGLTDLVELRDFPQCVFRADCDGDGLLDGDDFRKSNGNASCVLKEDCDGDSVPDSFDDFVLDASETEDTDGDGIGNNRDDDIDGDGILNVNETDIDNDGVLNVNEIPGCERNRDCDRDGLTDKEEYNKSLANSAYKKCRNDPDCDDDGIVDSEDNETYQGQACDLVADCDGDGIVDGDELSECILKSDCDGDGIADGDEVATICILRIDCDEDGINDDSELVGCALSRDCDNDGILDSRDLGYFGGTACSLESDCDGDGIADGDEVAAKCVIRPDCDNDGILDSAEAARRCIRQGADCDGDGIIDRDEEEGCVLTTDCDGDTIADNEEVASRCIGDPDCDDDNVPDNEEAAEGCITDSDCDNDGTLDGVDPCPLQPGALICDSESVDIGLFGVVSDNIVFLVWQDPYTNSSVRIEYGVQGQSVSVVREDEDLEIEESHIGRGVVINNLQWNTEYRFTVKITNIQNRTLSHSQTIRLTTKALPDTDGDGVLDREDQCLNSQNSNFVSISDLSKTGVNDVDADGCEDTTEDSLPRAEAVRAKVIDESIRLRWRLPGEPIYRDAVSNIEVRYRLVPVAPLNAGDFQTIDLSSDSATSYIYTPPPSSARFVGYQFEVVLSYASGVSSPSKRVIATIIRDVPDADDDGILDDDDQCDNSRRGFISNSDLNDPNVNDVDADGCEDAVEDDDLPAVSNLVAADGSGSIRINWQLPNVSPRAIEGFIIRYKQLPNGGQQETTQLDASATSYDLSLSAEGDYAVSVVVVYKGGGRSASDEVTANAQLLDTDNDGIADASDNCNPSQNSNFVSISDLNNPNVNDVDADGCEDATEDTLPSVTSIGVDAGIGSIRFRWALPSAPYRAAVSQIQIRYREGNLAWKSVNTPAASATSYTFTPADSLELSISYQIQIKLFYSSGASSEFATATRTISNDEDGDGVSNQPDQCDNSRSGFISNSDLSDSAVNDVDGDGCEDAAAEEDDLPIVSNLVAVGAAGSIGIRWRPPSIDPRAVEGLIIRYKLLPDGEEQETTQLDASVTSYDLSLSAEGDYAVAVVVVYKGGGRGASDFVMTTAQPPDTDNDDIADTFDECLISQNSSFVSISDLSNPVVNDVDADGCEDAVEDDDLPKVNNVIAAGGTGTIEVFWQPPTIDPAAIEGLFIRYRQLPVGAPQETSQLGASTISYALNLTSFGDYAVSVGVVYKSGGRSVSDEVMATAQIPDIDSDGVADGDDECLISQTLTFVSNSDLNDLAVNDVDGDGCEDTVEDSLPSATGLSAEGGIYNITISWQLPAGIDPAAIRNIKIRYNKDDDGEEQDSTLFSSMATSYTLPSLQPGPYSLQVVLIYKSGVETISPPLNTVLLPPDTDGDGIEDAKDQCRPSQTSDFVSNSNLSNSAVNDVDGDGCEDAVEDDDLPQPSDIRTNPFLGSINISWQLPAGYEEGIERIQLNYSSSQDPAIKGAVDLAPTAEKASLDNVTHLRVLGEYVFTITLFYKSNGRSIAQFSEIFDRDVDDDDDGIEDGQDSCRSSVTPNFISDISTNDMDGDGCEDAVEDIDDDGDGLIEISSANQLAAIRHQLDGRGQRMAPAGALDRSGCGGSGGLLRCNGYELQNDISLASYGAPKGWQPIGAGVLDGGKTFCEGEAFTGILEGNGYTISDLMINRPAESCVGLFAMLSGEVRNLHIVTDTINAYRHIGPLAGFAPDSKITGVTARTNQIEGSSSLGGLIGFGRRTTISSASVEVNTLIANNKTVGGMVAWFDYSQLVNSSAIVGSVSSTNYYAGGLVAYGRNTTIMSSFAQAGPITGGAHNIGGLMGLGTGSTIRDSYAAVEQIIGGWWVGGLIGQGSRSSIINSYAAADTIIGNRQVGGLAGGGQGAEIRGSYGLFLFVQAVHDVGELVGLGEIDTNFPVQNLTDTRVIDSYWDLTVGGLVDGSYGIGWETKDLVEPTDYTGIYADWDSSACDNGKSKWSFGTSKDYPLLQCVPLSLSEQKAGWPAELRDDDGDGLLNYADTGSFGGNQCQVTPDCDGDGTDDLNDAFPTDPTEQTDTDGDGTGDEADIDNDNDGIADIDDPHPDDPSNGRDADNDGIGDLTDIDDDGDGLIEIRTARELHAIRYWLKGTGQRFYPFSSLNQDGCGGGEANSCLGYELDGDISLANYRSANQGRGWRPIGSCDEPYEGIFDGNDYTISDLYINRSKENCVGLFAGLTGEVRNLQLEVDTISGRHMVGGLIGIATDATIINSSATVDRISDSSHAGGLIGRTWNTDIIDSSATVGSIIGGLRLTGGLVGNARGGTTIINSKANVDIISSDKVGRTGGLVGEANNADIINSRATVGGISGRYHVGGLVGRVWHTTIINSSATVINTINSEAWAGGLIGSVAFEGYIINASAYSGSIRGESSLGGLIGGTSSGAGRISHSRAWSGSIHYQTLTDSIAQGWWVGGLVGRGGVSPEIHASYAVTGSILGSRWVGGLVGYIESGSINSSYAVSAVLNGTGSHMGGLVGEGFRNRIHSSYAVFSPVFPDTVSGLIEIQNTTYGGFRNIIEHSYWDSDISGIDIDIDSRGMPKTTPDLRSPTSYADAIYSDWDDSYCDTNLNGKIDAEEQMDDNRIWNFGTNEDYPVLNCIDPGLQRRLWFVNPQDQLELHPEVLE